MAHPELVEDEASVTVVAEVRLASFASRAACGRRGGSREASDEQHPSLQYNSPCHFSKKDKKVFPP